jgi:hypothetical protein
LPSGIGPEGKGLFAFMDRAFGTAECGKKIEVPSGNWKRERFSIAFFYTIAFYDV